MAGRLFEDLVVSRGGTHVRAGGMPRSFVFHGAGLAALIALSLTVPEELPSPPSPTIGDVVFATQPRSPPVAGPRQSNARTPRPHRRAGAPVFDIPSEAPPIEPDFSADDVADVGCIGCAPFDGRTGGGGSDDSGHRYGASGPDTTAAGTGPLRVGGLIQPPRKIRNVATAYPDLARRTGVAGVVTLECVIDRDGLVQSVQVLTGHPLLNAAAVNAVRQWAYSPTRLNGVPVAVVMTVTVRFTTR